MKTAEELKQLATVAGDTERAPAERIAAFKECDAGRKEAKVGWSKLGFDTEQVQALKAEITALEGADTVEATAETSEEPGGTSEPSGDTFEATDDELNAQAGRPTVEQAKADEQDAEAIANADKKVKKAKAEGQGEARGGLTRLVESLLKDARLSYLDIINAVLKEFPKANTSARSIASVAAGMRRKGIDVPMRRPVAAPKPLKQTKAEAQADAGQGSTVDA